MAWNIPNILIEAQKKSGGGGGASDYSELSNKPQINSVTLSGNKSLSDLGIASASDVTDIQDLIPEDAATTNKLATADDLPGLASTTAPGLVQPDGTTVTINDGVISAVGGGSATYGVFSYTETEIGTWNNSTLYRIIVDVGALPSSATSKVITNAIPTNASVVKIYGMVYTNVQHSQGFQLPIPLISTTDNEDNIMCGVQANGSVYISVGKDRSSLTGIVVVEYTKIS